ncbi:MAG: MBL fold metallo-hydrolase [Terriglobia bacterium]
MTLKFLGTGTSTGVPIINCSCPVCKSSDPHDKRTRPSILLEYDGRAVVIDTTPDFRAQALREGLTRLDAVLFTHSHADHIMGFDDTRVFYFRQKVPLPIYAEARCMATLRATFAYIFEGNYPYGGVGKIDPHVVEGPFDLWGLGFTPVPVLHGNLPILGFRFRDTAYVTDVSEIPESSIPLLAGLDILIIDALRPKPHPTHLSLAQALAMVERLKPQRAFFTHIAHELGHEATSSTLPSHVQIAYDGLRLEF